MFLCYKATDKQHKEAIGRGSEKNVSMEERTAQHPKGSSRNIASSSRQQEEAVIRLKKQAAGRTVRVKNEDIPITIHDVTHHTALVLNLKNIN